MNPLPTPLLRVTLLGGQATAEQQQQQYELVSLWMRKQYGQLYIGELALADNSAAQHEEGEPLSADIAAMRQRSDNAAWHALLEHGRCF